MTTDFGPDILSALSNIESLLEGIFAAILFGIVVVIASALQNRRQFSVFAKAFNEKQFQAEASNLLSKARYVRLKQLCAERLQANPGDASAYYYLGMANFRCHEYVEAKRRFQDLVKLDAGWKKVATSHLEAIEAALKETNATAVDGDR